MRNTCPSAFYVKHFALAHNCAALGNKIGCKAGAGALEYVQYGRFAVGVTGVAQQPRITEVSWKGYKIEDFAKRALRAASDNDPGPPLRKRNRQDPGHRH